MPRRFFNKNIPSFCPAECNFCGKILSRKATLLEHMQDMHSLEKKIRCTVGNCNYKTNRVGNYNLHLEKVHKINLPVIKCYSPGCGKRSRNETSMVKHMRRCKGKPKFNSIKCAEENCNEEFLTESGLKNHILLKHGNISIVHKEEKQTNNELEIFYKEIEELISL